LQEPLLPHPLGVPSSLVPDPQDLHPMMLCFI
jgi:hypothetical protein